MIMGFYTQNQFKMNYPAIFGLKLPHLGNPELLSTLRELIFFSMNIFCI
jgi:hypothetical protein